MECLNYLAYFSKVSYISGLSLVSAVESQVYSFQGEHMYCGTVLFAPVCMIPSLLGGEVLLELRVHFIFKGTLINFFF